MKEIELAPKQKYKTARHDLRHGEAKRVSKLTMAQHIAVSVV
jgi:DNA integrity scanning protein DisA with diadenylate cyclase activity